MTAQLPGSSPACRLSIGILIIIAFIILITLSSAVLQTSPLPGSPNPLVHFPSDYYKLDGSPDLVATLEESTVYQNENASLFLTLMNRGVINSIKVNEEPEASNPEEVYAAQLELELEYAKTTAQEISVRLSMPYPPNKSPLEIKREVAYAGTLLQGQVSPRLAFPVDVYENATPGEYTLYATVNYTFQRDVAVKGEQDRIHNPDMYYLYDSASQVVPLKIRVERRSGAEFRVLSINPEELQVGSKDNVVRINIENVGYDTAWDLVARLRPESGIYVSVDESPIPALAPGQKSELIYKLDVSKDAVAGKRYMLKLLFEFSDSFREDLTETEHAYLMVGSRGFSLLMVAGPLAVMAAAAALIMTRRRKGPS